MERRDVLAARLANQRLTGPPAGSPEQVVGELLAVQSQDAALARAMIAYRIAAPVDEVDAAVADGRLVRTHILRPTWHYVAAADLRWLLDLTTTPLSQTMGARERHLGIDDALVDRALAVFTERLAGRRYAVRRDLAEALTEAGVLDRGHPEFNGQVGHLIGFAEYRAVVCSAPVDSPNHHYALVDEVVPPQDPLPREAAVVMLVERFVTGHGPVSVKELQRWTRLRLDEIRPALAALGDRLTSRTVEGVELWSAAGLPETRPRRAWLLSIFDEAFLTYSLLNFPRSGGHPSGDTRYRFAEAGGGVVLCDLRDVGLWQRRVSRGSTDLRLTLDPDLSRGDLAAIDEAAELLRATIRA